MNLSAIALKIRTLVTGHPVIAATSALAMVGAVVFRWTGWDLKILDGLGRMNVAQGNWYQQTAANVGEKRLAKAVAKAEKKALRVKEIEQVRADKAHRKAEEAEAKARKAAEAAANAHKAGLKQSA